MARNEDFAKGEGLDPQVKNFFKYIKIGRRGEQICATQAYRKWEAGGEERFFVFFLEKLAVLMQVGSNFARFQSHLKEQNY